MRDQVVVSHGDTAWAGWCPGGLQSSRFQSILEPQRASSPFPSAHKVHATASRLKPWRETWQEQQTSFPPCVSLLHLIEQSTTHWEPSTKETFFSQFWRLEIQEKVTAGFIFIYLFLYLYIFY